MKNIRLIAFFFFLGIGCGSSVCFGADIISPEASLGLKLTFPFLELRGAARCKREKLWPPDYNYGLMIDTEPFYKKVSVVAKAGNLLSGGSLSLLNSPSFSQEPSSFGLDTALGIDRLTATLPAKDNYTSLMSYFLQGTYNGSSIFQKADLNFFYDTKKLVTSSSIRLEPTNKIDLDFCFTGGLFPLDKTKDDSWYLPAQYYAGGKHICMNLQTGIRMGNYNGVFTVGGYETPFSSYMAVWRLENQIRTKHFCTILDFFYNPNTNLITSSGKVLNPLLQMRSGSMIKYNSITGGTGFLLDINATAREHYLKTQGGIKYESDIYRGSLTASFDMTLGNPGDHLTVECPKGNILNTNNIYIKDFKLELSPKFYFERSSKGVLTYTEKFGFCFEYDGIFQAGFTANIELKHKNNFTDKKFGWDSKVSVEGKVGFVGWSLLLVIKS